MTTTITGATGIDKVVAGVVDGTLLQTVTSSSDAATFVNDGTDWHNPTGMNVTITPSKTTSKIMLNWHTSVMLDPDPSVVDRVNCRIMRGSTEVFRLGDHYAGESAEWRTYVESGVFIDSPVTTSEITYYIQFKSTVNGSANALRINNYNGNLLVQATEIGA
mgnify:CR=1 FL=1|tara:strand:+ start:8 stop:493 length:486 start_codon:yes stop_codon:yes gene_type:complete